MRCRHFQRRHEIRRHGAIKQVEKNSRSPKILRLTRQIVFRKGEDGAILFAPATGKAFALNASSEFICESLSREISSEELLSQMYARYPGENADEIRQSLWLYLGRLKALGYLAGFEGEAVDAEKMPESALSSNDSGAHSLPENHLLYKGNSMTRVFVQGDILVVKEIPMVEFLRGDIVAFKLAGAKDGIVHRIVRILPDGFATMGDNNPRPDTWAVTAKDHPQLVVERIDIDGRHHRIARGGFGRLSFRWHRCRYWTHRILSKIYRFFFPR